MGMRADVMAGGSCRRTIPSIAESSVDPCSACPGRTRAMSVFARNRTRQWICLLSAVMLGAIGLSAHADAAVVEGTPYSGTDTWMDDSCGYRTDVAATFSGRTSVRTGTGPATSFFFFTDNYSFREVHTDPATGRWFVVRGNGLFKDVQAKPVGGNVFEVKAMNVGQSFVVEDSTGKVAFRFAGVVTFRYLFDTGGDNVPGGQDVEFLGATVSGHDPQVSLCSAAGSLIGTGSASRLTGHPLGSTSSPLGYYEYLPPTYGQGTKKPLLVFLHGYGGTGDGSPAQLPNVINDAGIPLYIANNGWATDRPFVVLAPQHNDVPSPAYPYPCDVPFGGSCVMQLQHGYGNPLPAGSPCWAPSEVQAFLGYALTHYDVDPARVYLTGLSCGGYGVWESLGQSGATTVAAAVPIAGEGRPALGSSGCALASTPIWAFHGDADDVVNPAGSIDTINSLRTCPAPPAKDLRLTIYPQVDHNSWDHAYSGSQGQDIYSWMLGFTTN
jgi:predicted esterase